MDVESWFTHIEYKQYSMLALSQLTPFLFPKIHAEEISGNNGYVELSFCAKKLDDKVRNDVVLFFIKKH